MSDRLVIKDIQQAGFDAVLGEKDFCEHDYLDDYFIVAKKGYKGLYKYNWLNDNYVLSLAVDCEVIDYFKIIGADFEPEIVFAYKKRGKWRLFYKESFFNHKLLGETLIDWFYESGILLAKRNGKRVLFDLELMAKGFAFETPIPKDFEFDIIDFNHNHLFCWLKKEETGQYAVFSKSLVQITEFLFDENFSIGIDGDIQYSINGKKMKQPSIFHFHKHYAIPQH